MNALFFLKCLYHIHDGLCNGLSAFSGPSRAALIFSTGKKGALRVYDPQNLLQGHEPRIRELYLREKTLGTPSQGLQDDQLRCENIELAGLIGFGGESKTMSYQMWFTEHHVDLCSTGPTERWLEHACRLLSQNMGSRTTMDISTSGYVLQSFSSHAVRDHIVDLRNASIGLDTQLRIYPVLEAILAISKTQEEANWPWGDMVFVEPNMAHSVHYMATLKAYERPSLKDIKHIRKLLQAVEGNPHKLISNGQEVIGIGTGPMPPFSVTAEFRGRHGFVSVQNALICSFFDGEFHSSNRRPNLVHLEEALLELHFDTRRIHSTIKIVSSLVESAQERSHGCALVLDYSGQTEISGQHLVEPLNLTLAHDLELAKALAKVDGALHIDLQTMQLKGFACLMDGRALSEENRARGARFNSALRFTAEHAQMIVIVVSADRPLSVIQGGAERSSACNWQSQRQIPTLPPTLKDWLGKSR